jgi:hypothetical protein
LKPPAERSPKAIPASRPVRGLFKHIDNRQGFRARGAHKDPVAGLAALADVAPAVDGCCYRPDHGVHDQNCRQERQRGADDDPLQDTRLREPCEGMRHIRTVALVY